MKLKPLMILVWVFAEVLWKELTTPPLINKICLTEARGLRVNKAFFLLTILIALALPASAEMYKWVDEKGTVHFTDDISSIPEKYREGIEERETSERTPDQEVREKPAPAPAQKTSEPEGFEVHLVRRHELWFAEVILNDRLKRYLVVDTGASFTLISRQVADELGIIINENSPSIPAGTVSGFILTPLVTLSSIRVGKAEIKDVDVAVYTMPSGNDGLLGNSFLNKFRVMIDSVNGKMTLHSLQGIPSPDRPGGYGRDYWVGQFRFYNRNLAELKRLRTKYESSGGGSELKRVNSALQYFENRLSDLERRASLVGVPRNWRD
jgi:clan AA aspartic protease (TIGR02281 family)